MRCLNCGNELPDGAQFCGNCGMPAGGVPAGSRITGNHPGSAPGGGAPDGMPGAGASGRNDYGGYPGGGYITPSVQEKKVRKDWQFLFFRLFPCFDCKSHSSRRDTQDYYHEKDLPVFPNFFLLH